MIFRNWNRAKEFVLQLEADVAQLPYSSFREEDNGKRTCIASPIPGYRFELDIGWMLNGSWTVIIEVERSFFFGLVYRSISKFVEITPDGPVTYDSFTTRIESFEGRKARRNWGREEDESFDS